MFIIQCPDNTHTDDRKCSGFVWRDDLVSPIKTLSEQCNGPVCSMRATPAALHQKCIRRFCKQCCTSANQTSPGLNCIAPRHPKISDIPLLSTPQQPLPQPSQPLLQPLSQEATSSHVHAEQSYGRMLSPIYQQKLRDNNFASINTSAQAAQREKYRRETAHTVRVRWWSQVSKSHYNILL